jgi:hypothetical protein
MFAGDCPYCADPENPPAESGEIERCVESGVVLRCGVVSRSEPSDVLVAELMSIPRPVRSVREIEWEPSSVVCCRVSSIDSVAASDGRTDMVWSRMLTGGNGASRCIESRRSTDRGHRPSDEASRRIAAVARADPRSQTRVVAEGGGMTSVHKPADRFHWETSPMG